MIPQNLAQTCCRWFCRWSSLAAATISRHLFLLVFLLTFFSVWGLTFGTVGREASPPATTDTVYGTAVLPGGAHSPEARLAHSPSSRRVFAEAARSAGIEAVSQAAVAATLRATLGLGLCGLLLSAALAVIVSAVQRRRQTVEGLLRVRAASLFDSEQYLFATLRAIDEAVIACDRQGRVVTMSHSAERLTGWSGWEAVGRPLLDVLPLVDAHTRQSADLALNRALRDGEVVVSGEAVALVTRDGALRRVEGRCAPIRDGSGMVLGAVVTVRDVSEEWRRREAFEEAMALQQALFDDLPLGLVIVDAATQRIERVSSHAVELFGAPPSHLLGQRSQALLRTVAPDTARGDAGGSEEGGDGDEALMLRADGSLLPVKRTVLPIQLGQREKVLECVVDTSRRSRAEAKLVEVCRRLQEELGRARAMAEAAEAATRAKSGFLATVSNELRTPLNAMAGLTAQLGDDSHGEGRAPLAELLTRCNRAMLGVVDDIDEVARMERGTIVLDAVDFNLRQLLDEVVAAMAVKARDKGLELQVSVDPEVPSSLRGDPRRLRQILVRLVDNAIKFTTRGAVALSVALAGENAAGKEVPLRLAVADSGVGIAADVLDRILAPAASANLALRRACGGTGLGLIVARELVELMGGTIGVRNVPGEGAEFSFTARFGAVCQAGGEEENALTQGPARTGEAQRPVGQRVNCQKRQRFLPRPGGDRCRILVADDNATNRKVAEGLLEALGLAADGVVDGRDAVEAVLAAPPYDLILMDLQMPGMDGIAATREIRACPLPLVSAVPIIAMTGSAAPGDREMCLAAGMNDFLAKPFSLCGLTEVLSRWLPEENMEVAAGEHAPPTRESQTAIQGDTP